MIDLLGSLVSWIASTEERADTGALTLDRLVHSRHVADLHYLVNATLLVFLMLSVGAVATNWITEVFGLIPSPGQDTTCANGTSGACLKALGNAAIKAATFIGSIVPITIGICAWAYNRGSARLGTVDLFAAEISTLCRVMTIVGMVERCTVAYQSLGNAATISAPAHTPVMSRFLSEEKYTTIYDGNAQSLRELDVSVISNSTKFYTYYKSMCDSLRRFMDLRASANGSGNVATLRNAMIDVIYTEFLALESGRKAITQLVEYPPVATKDTITILLSELLAYGFLLHNLDKGDFRLARLELRDKGYREVFEATCRTTENAQGDEWQKAKRSLVELKLRFNAVFAARPTPAPQAAPAT